MFQTMSSTFEFQSRTRVVFGVGVFNQLGVLARSLNFRRTLLVADRGLVAVGYVERAIKDLRGSGIEVFDFHEFDVDPDSKTVAAGRSFAAPLGVDSIIALGGGSSLDCGKGINFLLTNGGSIQDYIGYGKATKQMLPMIGIPTTAGTGSEVQSYAVLSDAASHRKMACGDPQAAFRVAILDPELTLSQPTNVTATSGFDALTHAIETFVSTRRTPVSQMFSREAWRLLDSNYEQVLANPNDLVAREAMQLGACLAGLAIENSMLGATHACANPLTAQYGTTHGAALAMLLPTVVRWNNSFAAADYAELLRISGYADIANPAERLALRLEELASAGALAANLRAVGVTADEFANLADEASTQWTGRFNPRPFDLAGALEIYQRAYQVGEDVDNVAAVS